MFLANPTTDYLSKVFEHRNLHCQEKVQRRPFALFSVIYHVDQSHSDGARLPPLKFHKWAFPHAVMTCGKVSFSGGVSGGATSGVSDHVKMPPIAIYY